MSAVDCTREPDVVAAVLAGTWPEGCEQDLRGHVEGCAECRDAVAIATVLRKDCDAMRDAPIPAAGQVWWRSAIRARAEAAHAAARPMVWLQAITGAAAVGALAAGVSMAWPSVGAVVGRVMPLTGTSLHDALPLLLAIGAGIVAAPIAFYLAVPRD